MQVQLEWEKTKRQFMQSSDSNVALTLYFELLLHGTSFRSSFKKMVDKFYWKE